MILKKRKKKKKRLTFNSTNFMIVSCLIGGQPDIAASLQWQKSFAILSGAPLFHYLSR